MAVGSTTRRENRDSEAAHKIVIAGGDGPNQTLNTWGKPECSPRGWPCDHDVPLGESMVLPAHAGLACPRGGAVRPWPLEPRPCLKGSRPVASLATR